MCYYANVPGVISYKTQKFGFFFKLWKQEVLTLCEMLYNVTLLVYDLPSLGMDLFS